MNFGKTQAISKWQFWQFAKQLPKLLATVGKFWPNSGWGFSASFPLPARGADPDLEDDGALCRAVTVDVRTRFNNKYIIIIE